MLASFNSPKHNLLKVEDSQLGSDYSYLLLACMQLTQWCNAGLVIATPKLTHQIPHEKTQPVDISASRYGA
jgi:hypothetical protein